MASVLPWLAVAGLGAFHGLSPANGWMFAAACGLRAQDGAAARRALLPIAIGHATSIAVVACAVAQGIAFDRSMAQLLAGALLLGIGACRWLRGAGTHPRIGPRMGHAGIAMWSFLMASAHGSGLMLVPALVPLCLADNPAREITASGSMLLALGAVGVHTAAMLLTTGLIASGVCRGAAMQGWRLHAEAVRRLWAASLGIVGLLLIVLS